jgi:hypothetical protein
MGLVEGSGICIATSSSGVNSPVVTVTPMPSRQRSVERPHSRVSFPGRTAVTRTSESNGKRGLRRCLGCTSFELERNMTIDTRLALPSSGTVSRSSCVSAECFDQVFRRWPRFWISVSIQHKFLPGSLGLQYGKFLA